MDIGTAKLAGRPSGAAIPHHLLDLLDVTEPLTVAEFQQRARADDRRRSAAAARRRCWSAARRSTPARSSTASSSPAPTRRCGPGWRRELDGRRARRRSTTGSAERRPRGRRADPARQRPPDRPRARGRRDHRAAVHRDACPSLEYADPHTVQIGVDIDRADPGRADRGAGRRDVRRPASSRRYGGCSTPGLAEGRTAREAIGYRQVAAYLAGELTLDEAREQTVPATRRFARRQDSWFRKDPRIVWVAWDDPDRVERALAAVARRRCDAGVRCLAGMATVFYTAMQLDGFIADPRQLAGVALRAGHRPGGADGATRRSAAGRRAGDGRQRRTSGCSTTAPGASWAYAAADLGVHPPRLPRAARRRTVHRAPTSREVHAEHGRGGRASRTVWLVGGGGPGGQFADAGLLDEVMGAVSPR